MSRPKAIIVDLDGTLCNSAWRVFHIRPEEGQKKNWNAFNKGAEFDQPNQWCLDLVYAYHNAGFQIVFLTARSGSPETKAITENWLRAHVTAANWVLFMRKNNDYRPDYTSKQEVYNLEIAPYYDVQLAIDDKPAVCAMWRTVGITSLLCDNLEG